MSSTEDRKDRGPRALAGLALVAVCAGLVGAGALAGALLAAGAIGHRETTVATTVVRRGPSEDVTVAKEPARAIYTRVAPGVAGVSARVSTEVETPFGPRVETTTRTGSASVLDRGGHILTAEHVVADAVSVTVKLQGGAVRKARVLGEDPATDVAVLKIDPAGLALHPVTLGSLRALKIGDRVFAIGDPFGYARSLSSGLVSGLDRTIEAPNGFTVAHAIQTDAALNPGNSGGPLLDTRGRVIGVVDQIATGSSQTATNTGVGFAVPVDVVKAVLPELERGLTPTHAYLGVGATDARPSGALVQEVRAGSPAASAGVRTGDVIVSLGTSKVTGVGDLVAALARRRSGDRVTLTIRRGSRTLTLRPTLAAQPTAADSAG